MPARAPSPPEQRLTAYAGAIRHRPLGWRALWVHLSRLKEADAAQVKETALRVLAPIVRQRPGEVFELASGDLVLMVEGVTPDDMAGLAHTIGFMAGAFRRDGLATAFDLNRDFAPFEALLKNLAFPVPPEAPSEPVAAKPAAAPAASAARAPVWQPIAQPQPPAAPQAPKGLIERRAICAAFGDETLQRHGVHLRANIEAAIAAFLNGRAVRRVSADCAVSYLQPPGPALVLAADGAQLWRDLGEPVYQAGGYQGSARFRVYRSEPEPEDAPPLAEGEYLSLIGYQLEGNTLILRWRVEAPVMPPVSVFVHLDEPDGSLGAAYDALGVPADYWQAGDEIGQRYLLEPSPPAGEYQLVVGLYALDDSRRRYSSIPLTTVRVP